jgi:hypothetical protein
MKKNRRAPKPGQPGPITGRPPVGGPDAPLPHQGAFFLFPSGRVSYFHPAKLLVMDSIGRPEQCPGLPFPIRNR